MPITVSEQSAHRGKTDARRHREKQRDAIRKKLPEIIAEESIITKRGKGKTVKIPIKALDIPHFRPTRKTGGGGIGIGQGGKKKGDVLGRKPNEQAGNEEPGNRPGEDYIETEVELEELITMMLDDVGLPRLEEKQIKAFMEQHGFKFKGLQKTGPSVLEAIVPSVMGGMGRFWAYLKYLAEITGADKKVCAKALRQTKGIGAVLKNAQELIQRGAITLTPEEERGDIVPVPLFEEEDLRFLNIQPNIVYRSRAVVIAMMDVSGSMYDMKKYLARCILFWLTQVLRREYEVVDIRFIIHHATARLVPEEDFFRTMESGGTVCASAYDLAGSLIDKEYPRSEWNIYVWHFSDGEDFNPQQTSDFIRQVMSRGVNMIGYGEIITDSSYAYSNTLWEAFQKYLPVSFDIERTIEIMQGGEHFPFLGVRIRGKEDILPAMRAFLDRRRWENA